MLDLWIGLARAVDIYTHRIWPYIRWFPCQKQRVYTMYIYGFGQPYLIMHDLHCRKFSSCVCYQGVWAITSSFTLIATADTWWCAGLKVINCARVTRNAMLSAHAAKVVTPPPSQACSSWYLHRDSVKLLCMELTRNGKMSYSLNNR
jgi:hypothetical protein